MIGRSKSLGTYFCRSWLVYLWVVAAAAWLIHSVQHVLRHGAVLFEIEAQAATLIVANTLADIIRPVLIGGICVAPFVLIGYWRGSARR